MRYERVNRTEEKPMRYELANRIAEAVKEEIGEGPRVSLKETRRNNGVTSIEIEIHEPGESVFPLVRIDSFMDGIASGRIGVNDAARKVAEIYKESGGGRELYDTVNGIDKRFILGNVVCQLINREKNKERLCDMPHRKFLDLAVVYRVIVGESRTGMSGFMVKSVMCEAYGISEEELEYAAMRNTEQRGFEVREMASFIEVFLGVSEEKDEPECPMYVLTSKCKINGATVMLYSGYFSGLAEGIGSDLYVLPSSIHEVIAVPVGKMEPRELRAIVRKVNSSEVMAEEVLSENVYRYSRKKRELVIA